LGDHKPSAMSFHGSIFVDQTSEQDLEPKKNKQWAHRLFKL